MGAEEKETDAHPGSSFGFQSAGQAPPLYLSFHMCTQCRLPTSRGYEVWVRGLPTFFQRGCPNELPFLLNDHQRTQSETPLPSWFFKHYLGTEGTC